MRRQSYIFGQHAHFCLGSVEPAQTVSEKQTDLDLHFVV